MCRSDSVHQCCPVRLVPDTLWGPDVHLSPPGGRAAGPAGQHYGRDPSTPVTDNYKPQILNKSDILHYFSATDALYFYCTTLIWQLSESVRTRMFYAFFSSVIDPLKFYFYKNVKTSAVRILGANVFFFTFDFEFFIILVQWPASFLYGISFLNFSSSPTIKNSKQILNSDETVSVCVYIFIRNIVETVQVK